MAEVERVLLAVLLCRRRRQKKTMTKTVWQKKTDNRVHNAICSEISTARIQNPSANFIALTKMDILRNFEYGRFCHHKTV